MKVKCITDNYIFFTKGRSYDVESQGQNPYVLQGQPYYKLQDNRGYKTFVLKNNFSVCTLSDVEDDENNSHLTDSSKNGIMKLQDNQNDEISNMILNSLKNKVDLKDFIYDDEFRRVIHEFTENLDTIAKKHGGHFVSAKKKSNEKGEFNISFNIKFDGK